MKPFIRQARAWAGVCAAALVMQGCVTTGTATQSYQAGMTKMMAGEYHTIPKPIDRHFIGAIWSKQYGPVYDEFTPRPQIKTERSFESLHQNQADSLLLSVGLTTLMGVGAGAGIENENIEKIKAKGVELIRPVDLADVEFETDVAYVTEALRVGGFEVVLRKGVKLGGKLGGSYVGNTAGVTGGTGGKGESISTVKDLVVGYKLSRVDAKTYRRRDTGRLSLALSRRHLIDGADMTVEPYLEKIAFGGGKSLSNRIIWACPRARAKKKRITAAWVVKLTVHRKRDKTLLIGFPAFPEIEQCNDFESVVWSRLDPRTDKIHRKKVRITLQDASLDHRLNPNRWNATLRVTDESFKVMTVIKSAEKNQTS